MSCSDTFGSLFSRVVPYDNIRYHSTTCHQNVLMYVESLCSFHWLPRLCHPVFNLVFQAVKLFFGAGWECNKFPSWNWQNLLGKTHCLFLTLGFGENMKKNFSFLLRLWFQLPCMVKHGSLWRQVANYSMYFTCFAAWKLSLEWRVPQRDCLLVRFAIVGFDATVWPANSNMVTGADATLSQILSMSASHVGIPTNAISDQLSSPVEAQAPTGEEHCEAGSDLPPQRANPLHKTRVNGGWQTPSFAASDGCFPWHLSGSIFSELRCDSWRQSWAVPFVASGWFHWLWWRDTAKPECPNWTESGLDLKALSWFLHVVGPNISTI